MTTPEVRRFTTHVTGMVASLRNLIKSGEGRSTEAKEGNYREIQDLLRELRIGTQQETDVKQGAGIIGTALGRTVEIQKPPNDNGAARKLKTLQDDASAVTATINGIYVQLDCDQLKHQPASAPIGTRQKGGGNKFIGTCNAAWHQANTLVHMATWASGLGAMAPGQTQFHGQATPVNGIHYEGFCLFANGQKYVAFHCYPSDSSPLKL